MSNNDHVRNRLMEKYSANEHGTWKILGEDPNCDWGGYHHEPELCVVTGTYANVVEFAMNMTGFWQWGAGGSIVKIAPTVNVDKFNSPRVVELKAEKAKIEKTIAEARLSLAKIEVELDKELSTP